MASKIRKSAKIGGWPELEGGRWQTLVSLHGRQRAQLKKAANRVAKTEGSTPNMSRIVRDALDRYFREEGIR